MEPAPRSREEFLAYARTGNREFCDRQSIAGRPVMIEYLRGASVPTGATEKIFYGQDGHIDVPIYGKGEPIGVLVAYRDEMDRIRVGWSLRDRERETGIVVYRTGRRAGRSYEFDREVETKPFSKVEGIYRALRRASSYYDSRHPEPPSLIEAIHRLVGRFVDEERKRAEKRQLGNVAS